MMARTRSDPVPLDLELLDHPASEGARAVALALLADASDAAARTGDASDEEALHDFRVAVRRLRSTLRAWRPVLGKSLRERDVRRLRRVARATNEARDVEVLRAWLAEVGGRLAEEHRGAADWLGARLDHRLRRVLGSGVSGSVDAFLRRAPRLARRLAAEQSPGPVEPFGAVLAALVRGQAAAVAEALEAASSPPDAARAHRARIEGKRLRYLLEPLRGTPGLEAAAAVKALKQMQDALGSLNDARVAAAEIATARVEAAAERVRADGGEGPGVRPGLLALERLAHRRAATLLAEVERDHLADRGASVLAPALAVADALEARAAHEAPERPVRRFLLSGLPPEAMAGEVAEVEKGWIPGSRARECLGTARGAGGAEFFRVVQAGPRAPARARSMDRAAFDAYWPLTEGRRVHKRCRSLPDGWRLDEYLDRTLVLAIHEGAPGPLPAWLEPWVVREVTRERAYRDEALAARAPRRA